MHFHKFCSLFDHISIFFLWLLFFPVFCDWLQTCLLEKSKCGWCCFYFLLVGKNVRFKRLQSWNCSTDQNVYRCVENWNCIGNNSGYILRYLSFSKMINHSCIGVIAYYPFKRAVNIAVQWLSFVERQIVTIIFKQI